MQSWESYKSFYPLWCWVWLVSLWERVSHPSRCGLSKVGTVETVEFRQVMWLVMLESAKDRILGVDIPRQHVPPRVQYGTTCLLIRYAIGCVSCSVEWGWPLSVWPICVTFCVNRLNNMLQKGPLCARNLSTASGDTVCGKPYQSMTYSCSRP
jgi:hypothetical protein